LIYTSSNNDRHPVIKTFIPLHYTCQHFTSFHLKLHSTTLHSTTLVNTSLIFSFYQDFGIISHIICHKRGKKEAFGNPGIIFVIIANRLLKSVVWEHCTFTVGTDIDTQAYFTSATILTAVPAGNKIFRWLVTIYR